MEKDFNIFGDKNFSDLSQEIYENNKLKKTQIDLLIQEVHGYIQGIEDIAIVGPIIKELMDVGIKNDDNLVKLATIYQRIMSKQPIDDSDVGLLSEEEKEQLMATLEDVTTDLQKKSDEIVDMTKIRNIWPEIADYGNEIDEQIEINSHYRGYLKKQKADILAFKRDENLLIPENIDYDQFSGLSNEVKSKFKEIRPKTMGQALRIDGITPAAVYILLSHVKRKSIKHIA